MQKEINDFYIVKKNDTLDKIAMKCKIPSLKIILLNKISPLSIKEGDVILVKTSS